MDSLHFMAPDGVRLVYDVTGDGPALILLHGGGGGQTRRSWHDQGYVERLRRDFTVITPDIRGHGSSDKPTAPEYYTIDKMCQDVLTLADIYDIEQFALWGFSFGGQIGRYLAARTNRVTRLIIIGSSFGPAGGGDFGQFVQEFRAHWSPLVQAYLARSLDPASLAEDDQAVWQQMDVPVTLAWVTAMLDWGDNEPDDLNCPTLWFSGSENENAMTSINQYHAQIKDTSVEVHIEAGLDHVREFNEIDLVFPTLSSFTRA